MCRAWAVATVAVCLFFPPLCYIQRTASRSSPYSGARELSASSSVMPLCLGRDDPAVLFRDKQTPKPLLLGTLASWETALPAAARSGSDPG